MLSISQIYLAIISTLAICNFFLSNKSDYWLDYLSNNQIHHNDIVSKPLIDIKPIKEKYGLQEIDEKVMIPKPITTNIPITDPDIELLKSIDEENIEYPQIKNLPNQIDEVISSTIENANDQKANFQFNNPKIAFSLWNILDPIEETQTIPEEYYEGTYEWTATRLIIKEDDYCKRAREAFINNTDIVFNEQNMLVYYQSSLMRKTVALEYGSLAHPNFIYRKDMSKTKNITISLSPILNLYFIWAPIPRSWIFGRHYACSHQIYNHLLDINSLYTKSRMDQNYKNYVDRYKNTGRDHCTPSFLPDSYLLDNKTQCQNFFKYINTEKYIREKEKRSIVFLSKIGSRKHGGQGVDLVNETVELELKNLYKNGELCGQIPDLYQIQRYIPNPVLLHGHKFDIRVYLFIVSTNPIIAYYHDGNCRVSLHKYDPKAKEKGAHLTNTHLSQEIFERVKQNGTWEGMNEIQLLDFQSWNFSRIIDYLLENKIINDPNWLETSFRDQIKKAMVHMVRMTQHTYLKKNNMYQLMGVDFLLDDDLKLWLIEANKRPGLDRYNDYDNAYMIKLLKDHLDVLYNYLRSRMKRVVRYINDITKNVEYPFKQDILSELKAGFDKINMNYLEPEYQIKPDNGFIKIVDENLDGVQRYSGLINQDCL